MEIEVLLADGGGVDSIEEHEAAALLASHRAQMNVVSQARRARGFPPPQKSPDIRKSEARVKCRYCKEIDHFARSGLRKEADSGLSSTLLGEDTVLVADGLARVRFLPGEGRLQEENLDKKTVVERI